MSDLPEDPPAKSPIEVVVEHAVDTFVYAPIGLLFDGASLLPQLVEKGRSQVTMARMLGKFAVEQGREEATKAASKLQDQAAGVLDLLAGAAAPLPADGLAVAPPPKASRPAPRSGTKAPGAAREAARRVAGVVGTDSPASTKPTAPAKAGSTPAEPKAGTSPAAKSGAAPRPGAPTAASLAIPAYDGLSASHVVNRLAGLAPAELEAVRKYEAAHRGRKTILSKVAQLQSA